MSLQFADAIKKFYPVPAQDMIEESDIKCVEHSILKWKMILPQNIKKYNLLYDSDGVITSSTFPINTFIFDGSTCSLCIKYYDICKVERCEGCPLYIYNGYNKCDKPNENGENLYTKGLRSPLVMINALKGTLKLLMRGEDELI